MVPVLINLIIFGSIAGIIIAPLYFRSLERQKMAETLRVAIEKGQPLPTEVIDAMSSNVRRQVMMPSPHRDLRTGIIWTGVGVGFAAFGVAVGFDEPDALFPMLGLAAFPVFIGAAFIALGLLNRSKP